MPGTGSAFWGGASVLQPASIPPAATRSVKNSAKALIFSIRSNSPGIDVMVEALYCSNSQALISLALPRGRGMHGSGKRGEGDRLQPPPMIGV